MMMNSMTPMRMNNKPRSLNDWLYTACINCVALYIKLNAHSKEDWFYKCHLNHCKKIRTAVQDGKELSIQ